MSRWHSIVTDPAHVPLCPRCGSSFTGCFPTLGCTPHPCASCGTPVVLLTANDRYAAVSVDDAPAPVRAFLRWSDRELDEVELVELILGLQELLRADHIPTGSLRSPGPAASHDHPTGGQPV
jgi:hypothetical protein